MTIVAAIQGANAALQAQSPIQVENAPAPVIALPTPIVAPVPQPAPAAPVIATLDNGDSAEYDYEAHDEDQTTGDVDMLMNEYAPAT